MCESGDRAAMSVGYQVIEDEHQTIAGKDVRYITKARLDEVTLCREGVVTDTFAVLVDLADEGTQSLAATARSGAFRTAGSVANVQAGVRRILRLMRPG